MMGAKRKVPHDSKAFAGKKSWGKATPSGTGMNAVQGMSLYTVSVRMRVVRFTDQHKGSGHGDCN